MHPILLKIGPLTVYSYGTMLAIGFAVSFFLIYRQAIRNNIDKDAITNLALLTLFAGIAGGRILYIITNAEYYLAHPLEVFNLSKGGLVFYGGFFGGVAAFAYYSERKKIGFWNAADIFAPYLALTQAFGRIGCFLNGCCYGKQAEGGSLYPAQIYSSVLLAAIFLILLFWQKRRRFKGEVFLAYCLLYSIKRFFIEFLRGDNMPVAFGLTMSQLISISIFIFGCIIFSLKAREWAKRKTLSGLK